jgi:hypothetical protein
MQEVYMSRIVALDDHTDSCLRYRNIELSEPAGLASAVLKVEVPTSGVEIFVFCAGCFRHEEDECLCEPQFGVPFSPEKMRLMDLYVNGKRLRL